MRRFFLVVCLASEALAAEHRVAVLEFDASRAGADIDRTYFSDLVRGAVHKAAPQLFVMTRESTVELLKASGKKLEDCAGECEVETGKLLGADYVVSGRLTRVGTRFSLTLRLHATATGELLDTAEARGKSLDELVDNAAGASAGLVRRLAAPPPQAAAAAPEAKAAAPAPPPKPIAAPEPVGEFATRLRELARKPTPPRPPYLDARREKLWKQQERKAIADAPARMRDDSPAFRKLPDPAVGESEKTKLIERFAASHGEYFAQALFQAVRPVSLRSRIARALCTPKTTVGCAAAARADWDSNRKEAEELARGGCDRGGPTACSELGLLYELGLLRPRSAARELYAKACDLGDPYACRSSPLRDSEEAGKKLWAHSCAIMLGTTDCSREYLAHKALCDAGSAHDCMGLAWLYKSGGAGAPKDEALAAELSRKALPALRSECNEGSEDTCMSLDGWAMGGLVEDLPMEEAKRRSGASVLRRCEQGFLLYCFSIYTLDLEEFRKAWPKASALLQRACDAGDGDACGTIGFLVDQERAKQAGVGGDPEPWREKACAQGDGQSCDWLASVKAQDGETKAALERRACALGYANACAR